MTAAKKYHDGTCYIDTYATELLGLTDAEADELFSSGWKPDDGMSVPEALRDIGRGEEI